MKEYSVLILSVRLLFLYSLKGPFNRYLIYSTFIKSVTINNDSSQPLMISLSERRKNKWNQTWPKLQPYYLKSSVHVNRASYFRSWLEETCVSFEQKWNGLLQRRSKDYLIDKLRVAGDMKNKHRGVKLILLLFCFAQRPSSLVTLKSGKVWLLG